MEESKKEKGEALEQDYGTAFGLEDGGELGFKKTLKSILDDFKSLNYRFLIPIGKIFSSKLLRKKAVRWVLLFGLLPLVFFQFHAWFKLTFEEIIWLIQTYFVLFWALYFYSVIKPDSNVWKRAIGYALFTAFIGIPLLLISQKLPIIQNLYASTYSGDLLTRSLGFVFGVGLLEETYKALPLIIFGLRKGKIKNLKDATFLGLMSGFGFATAEGVQYTISATVSAQMYNYFSEQFMQFLFRIMTGPILHGAWAGTVGWFIGVAAVRSDKRWQIIFIGILSMAILHGLYDIFAGTIWGILLAGFTFLVFMAYLTHDQNEEINEKREFSK